MKELIDGLRTAMQAERAGYEFYKMAAERTADPQGKRTFLELAGEEQQHFEFLARQYRAVLETGELAQDATLERGRAPAAEHPIFSPELRGRLKGAHFEMSALAIAVQLELNGINHYKAMAAEAASPEARRFFAELVEWETAHYNAFLKEQQELQEAYWAEAGFAPF